MAHRAPMLAAVAAGVIVLGGALGGGLVMAAGSQAPNPSPSATPSNHGNGHQQQMDDYINKLAANLGIDASKLKDAMKRTALGELDQAVKDGKLTQQQADSIRRRIESGDTFFGLRGFDGGKGGPGKQGFGSIMGNIDALSTFLNVDAATLRGELGQGQSLAQIAQAHGKSRDDLKTFLTQQIHDRLQAAVTNGKLTQDQATQAEQKAAANLDNVIDKTFPMKGPKHGSNGNGQQPKPNGKQGSSQGKGRPHQPHGNGASFRFGITS